MSRADTWALEGGIGLADAVPLIQQAQQVRWAGQKQLLRAHQEDKLRVPALERR